MSKNTIIIIPVETKSRELAYKSALAFMLADLGYKVILGRQQEVRLIWYKFKNFIYIDKSSAKTKFKLYRDIKNTGGGIGVFCEEGLVYRSKEQYLSERIYRKSFDLIDTFWCWGNKQYKDINQKFNNKKLKIIDPPRFSQIYKYREKSRNVKIKKLVLFLTSFGRINKNINNNINHLQILKQRGTFNPNIGEKFYYDWEQYLKIYQASIIKLIKTCCNLYPEYQFQLRIHPSESKNKYDNLIRKFNNLKYSSYGLYEDISNSKIVISSHSTSSIESNLINPNSYVYSPISDSRFEPEIINELCSIVREEKEILSIINSNKLAENMLINSNKYFSVNNENSGSAILNNYAQEIINLSKNYKNKRTKLSLFIRGEYFLKNKLRNLLYSTNFKKDSKQVISKCKSISKDDIINYSKELIHEKMNKTSIQYNYKLIRCGNNVFQISQV